MFYNIPEKEKGSTAKTEDFVCTFLEEKLDMREEEVSDTSIERTHHLGRKKEDNKPRPINVKFSFHKDEERIRLMLTN